MTRKFKYAAVSFCLLSVWSAAAPFLAKYLVVEKPLAKADAILILGGSSVYVERAQKAAELFHQGVAPKIFLTDDGENAGWSQKEKRNPAYFDLAVDELRAHGIPREAIESLVPDNSGTIYESEELREKVRSQGMNSILIVTSAYHSRRALWVFQMDFAKNNLQTEIGIVHAATGLQTPSPYIWWLTPQGWRSVAGEYVKILYYWLSY